MGYETRVSQAVNLMESSREPLLQEMKRKLNQCGDLNQGAQAQNIRRNGNTMLTRNVKHGIQSQRTFQVTMQFHGGGGSLLSAASQEGGLTPEARDGIT